MTSLPDTMTWDNGRELKSFTKNNVTTTYNYDSNGMRVCKNGSDGKTEYYYDSNNMLVGTHFDNNTPNDKNDDTVVQFYYDTEGSPTSFRVNGSDPYFYVKNLQGDIEKIIEPNGAIKVTYAYDAWGNVTSVTDNTTNSLSTLNPFRYRGYVYDTESGFYYLKSRYYDPQIGRFLNVDVYFDTETGSPLSTNMFAYCENNSVLYYDPNGRELCYGYVGDKYTVYGSFDKNPYWNKDERNRWMYYANCYAYALNLHCEKPQHRLRPGELSGKIWTKYKNKSVKEQLILALRADLKKISKDLKYKKNHYIKAWNRSYCDRPVYGSGYDIAIFYSSKTNKNFDVHLYRKDKNGKWTHKMGLTPVTDLDASGKKIKDPRKCDRNYTKQGGKNYKYFAGIFRIYRYGIW